mmetsp:Transcript_44154/g.127732  ORF Transcript_44154/g.127732 Transcript_44154/m.127732 type:complete len:321 (-) Transcript_44154:2042-3004(-)
MLQLESQVGPPSISETGVERDGSVEPLAGLGVLPITPEELCHGHDDVRVVLALLQRINALGILPLLRLELDGLRPHEAAGWAFLKSTAHQVVGKSLTAIEHFHLHTLQPKKVSARIAQAALLKQGTCLGVALLPDLALHAAEPQWNAPRTALQAALEESRGVVQLRRRLLHVDLATDRPHLRVGWVLLQALLAQVQCLLEQALLSLQLHRLHPHLGSVTLLTSSRKQQAATLDLIILALQLHGCQVDRLGFLRVTERLGQNASGRGDVSAEPLLLCGHEPQDLCVRTVCHCTLQDVVQRLGGTVLRLKLRQAKPETLLVL